MLDRPQNEEQEAEARLVGHAPPPSRPNTPPLAKLQDMFQRAILESDPSILELVTGNSRTTAHVLFGVYGYAYKARLRDVLAVEHENLVTLMGRPAFDEMADAYLDAHPSRHANVRWLDRDLPEFLRQMMPYANDVVLGDIAALEQALTDAFDAADAELLTLDDLRAVAPDRWPDLTFEAHPSVRRLTLQSNAFDIWHALQTGSSSPATRASHVRHQMMVWRADGISRVRRLGNEEAMLWDLAAAGLPFGELCRRLAVSGPAETAPARVAAILQRWLADQLLSASVTRA